ncbi:MAG: ATP-binding protein [Ignavibacteria bacterium]|nr:ATP-binding protein [Ignavibacteria bacterium]
MVLHCISFVIAAFQISQQEEFRFWRWDNPVIFTVLFVSFLAILVYYISMKVVVPERLKMQEELYKKKLENMRMMSLFAEKDPNPLLRIDKQGNISYCNDAAIEIFSDNQLIGRPFAEIIIEGTSERIGKLIEQDESFARELALRGKYFWLNVIGFKELGFAQSYFSDITDQKNLNIRLANTNTQLRELSNYLNIAGESERKKIAKELHDGVGMSLSLIKLKLNAIGEVLKDNQLATAAFGEIAAFTDSVSAGIKEIMAGLHPRILEDFGLDASFRIYVEKVTEKTGLSGKYHTNRFADRFPPQFEITVYRLVQELINNIVKHARASWFSVTVSYIDGVLQITVDDDGVGFDEAKIRETKKGMGLRNLRERVTGFNGEIEIDSSPEEGTHVTIEFLKEHIDAGQNS